MSNHKNLIHFNKEGDYLNFRYNDSTDRFEGDILFHQNSSDTYKTYGLYTLERIPSFEFESPDELTLTKFQLFNEWGLHFYGGVTQSNQVTSIESVNSDSNFYSKWIYGENFESKFPIGSFIVFEKAFLEFNDPKMTYMVVASKKGAIMILSILDNASFDSLYFSTYTKAENYVGVTIRGINTVGVYNYIDSNFKNNLSKWSEPDFYGKYYIGKKLNIVNSEMNDGIVTVKDPNLTDAIHFEYWTTNIPADSNLIIEYKSRMDLPSIYEGKINISSDGIIDFGGLKPDILKPGVEFKIVGSTLNTNFLVVSDIPSFEGSNKLTYYATQSQVMFNNRTYECVKGYTHSYADDKTRYIDPTNTDYWTLTSYSKVEQTTFEEEIIDCQVYLTTDTITFEMGYTQSSVMTLASAADKYKEDFKSLNIDLYCKKGILKADLFYPSKYAEVNFFYNSKNNPIGRVIQTNERLVEVKEKLNYELNYNYSENFKYNLVFTDIDEYGIKVVINKEVYEEEVSFIYTGGIIDMERTIDRTLRKWLSRNYLRLYMLGINTELEYIGNYTSPFYNSIIIKSEYPNVPLNIDRVEVGSTADYHIEHSKILFNGTYSIGANLTITINDKDYEQITIFATSSTSTSKEPNVPATLAAWVNQHSEYLSEFGFIVRNINNLLKFDIKRTDLRLDYTLKTGKLLLPGHNDFTITNKIKGSEGILISSNEVTLPSGSTASFEDVGFATGMVFSINNTVYPFNNQEYNIQFLDPNVINLSYQGPFWGLTDSFCVSSGYTILAFNNGFGQTGCAPVVTATSSGGPFSEGQYDPDMFSMKYSSTLYEKTDKSFLGVPEANNLVDIKYIQLSNSIYMLGDGIIVLDAFVYDLIQIVTLPGNSNSIEMEFNPFNNYIYCLSKNKIWLIDPLLNNIVSSITLIYDAYDMQINPENGEIFVSYENSPTISVYDINSVLIKTLSISGATKTGKMTYNSFEKDVYITTDIDLVVRVNGDTKTTQATYSIPNLLLDNILYEPVNESIYLYNSDNLWKIDNGLTYSITSVTTSSFNEMLYNNITGEINLSNDTNKFKSISLNNNSVSLSKSVSTYGFMALNQYDAKIYLTSQTFDNIITIDPVDAKAINNEPIGAKATKIIYNPERKSIWAIQPSINSVIELTPVIQTSLSTTKKSPSTLINDQMYGTLHPDFSPKENMWLKTREYVRRPRENFEGDIKVKYYWKWLNNQTPEFFIYDLSGNQLEKTGSYAYTGTKPLLDVGLNRTPNKNIDRVSIPQYQQTVFDSVIHDLDYIDDSENISVEPEPLQLFLGFKSDEEGAFQSALQLYKKEEIELNITSSLSNDTIIYFDTIYKDGIKKGQIKINTMSDETFSKKGLKKGQVIAIYLKDVTNNKNEYISNNNGSIFIISEVYTKTIILDFFNPTNDFLDKEQSILIDYPSTGQLTYLKTTIKVLDREIGRFNVYAQTEVEDIRYKIELGNVGKNIGHNEIFIFKDYDILEGGVDWNFLNIKRKEMLMMKNLIYPYIGAYKSIINAINFFGYNDLQLNEYYRNIDSSSKDFSKLFKVEIPDIFDNTVEGWNDNDFLKHTFPNEKFEETNLLNLTYQITDKDGNNLLNYSIDDVSIKLQGLKYWLKKNIIPLTHKILDITGRSYFRGGTQIQNRVHDVRIFNTNENMTPITFKLTEAYLLPVNSGSTVYNCVIDFYTIVEGMAADNNPTGLVPPPRPLNGANLKLPDYFTVKIRTYKTYREWMPFTTYKIGDKVIYYGKLYESTINKNKINNPKKYEEVENWTSTTYEKTNIVRYKNEYYVYTGLGSETTSPPLLDQGDGGNWLNITEWKQIEFEPVQTLDEYRRIVPNSGTASNTPIILPYNFTVDSNLDPFIVIEVTSDNGYGSNYRDRKNYEIRGIKDLVDNIQPIERVGPFQPVELINAKVTKSNQSTPPGRIPEYKGPYQRDLFYIRA